MGGGHYVGQFAAWDGGCLFVGRHGGIVPPHAHYAIQIAFGSEDGIGFRTGEAEPWSVYGGAMIPSRQPHSMDVTSVRFSTVLFVEPETHAGRALTEQYLGDGIAAIPPDVLAATREQLFTAWLERRGTQAIRDAGWRIIRALTGGVQPLTVSDERILRATAYIRAHLDTPLTLEEVAEEACLSPSRFRHLFVEETGMALRPYILWRRFLRAWELVAEGQSLSAAAHGAGFADAAHLSRTSRTMFGIPPSAMMVGASHDAGADAHVYPPPRGAVPADRGG